MKDDVLGVILAAGKGTRLFPFSDRYPKPVLPICNKPLIEYQVETMCSLGIKTVFIVIAHLGFRIANELGDGSKYGVKIRYVDQGETLGIAHAVGKIESLVDRPFLLFLGEIFFITDDLSPMLDDLRSGEANAVLATMVEKDPDAIKRNFAVIASEDGYVSRVVEKPRYISTRTKGCGLYLFDQHIFDCIRRTPRTAMRDEYEITDAVQIMIDYGFKVRHRTLIKEDLNLTFPEDLLAINMLELKRLGRRSIIGENVQMSEGTCIENAVIGDETLIRNPIDISNCVILPESEVTTTEDIDTAIVTPERIVNFGRTSDEGSAT